MQRKKSIVSKPIILTLKQMTVNSEKVRAYFSLSRPIFNELSTRTNKVTAVAYQIYKDGKDSFEFETANGFITVLGDDYDVSEDNLKSAIIEMVLDELRGINDIRNILEIRIDEESINEIR